MRKCSKIVNSQTNSSIFLIVSKRLYITLKLNNKQLSGENVKVNNLKRMIFFNNLSFENRGSHGLFMFLDRVLRN